MKNRASFRPVVIGIVTLVIVYAATRQAVKHYRPPGSTTVIEAQAMDMGAISANTPLGSIPVAAEEVTPRAFAASVSYTGTVVAFDDTEIYPRVTGVITDIAVYPGDKVRKGQLLVRLDSAELSSKATEADIARDAAGHDVMIAAEEQRMAAAQAQSAKAKASVTAMALNDARAQASLADAMKDQVEREREAAELSLADARAGVVAMQADADYWRAEIARETNLFQQKAVTRDEFDRELAQQKAANAKLSQALAEVREKSAMIEAAKAKVRQALAGIVGAQARVEQARSAIRGAQADVIVSTTNAEAYSHRELHQGVMVKQAAAQAHTANILRGYTEIRADQDGIVSERLVSSGTLVQPGTPILKIKSDSRVRLQANVSEGDLADVRIGSIVTVTKPRDPAYTMQTHVTSLFHSADKQTRTVIVEALTPNPGGSLLPGEYVVMQISTSAAKNALTVPLQAVLHDMDQKPFVWTMSEAAAGGKAVYTCLMHPQIRADKPGKCPICGMELILANKSGKFTSHRSYISVGASDGIRVVVERGVSTGERVLTRGHENLNEGDPVTPVEWSESGPKSLPLPSAAMPNNPGMGTPPAKPIGGKQNGRPGDDMPDMPGMGGR